MLYKYNECFHNRKNLIKKQLRGIGQKKRFNQLKDISMLKKIKKKSKCKMFNNNNNIHHIKIQFVKLKLQNKNYNSS